MSLLYRPFSGTNTSDPEPLENTDDEGSTVIEEHEGIHYINTEVLKPNTEAEKNLNSDFQDLVNSVIK
jgi:hypothetical protein